MCGYNDLETTEVAGFNNDKVQITINVKVLRKSERITAEKVKKQIIKADRFQYWMFKTLEDLIALRNGYQFRFEKKAILSGVEQNTKNFLHTKFFLQIDHGELNTSTLNSSFSASK